MIDQSHLEVLAAALAGRRVEPAAWAGIESAELCAFAESQGVLALLAARAGALDGLPTALGEQLRERARGHLAADMAREAALANLLPALDDAGVRALLVKGAMLAYSHYPRPDLRQRLDTDLLIAEPDRTAADRVLLKLGYEADQQAGTDLIQYQRAYVLKRRGAPVHVVDLHWRLVNPEVFRAVFDLDDLAAASVPLASLGATARGVSAVHALAIACVHQFAHHARDERLIWVYDVHVIASGFSEEDWRRFHEFTTDRQIVAVCRTSLARATELLGTAVPRELWSEAGLAPEASRKYLERNRRHAEVVLDDLRAAPGWSERWRMMRAHVFPPATYMREVYAPSSSRSLAWLYLRRAVSGASKWLRKPS